MYDNDLEFIMSSSEDECAAPSATATTAGKNSSFSSSAADATEDDTMVVQHILSVRTGTAKEYYVKYKNFSYLHCEWRTEEELLRGDKRVIQKLKRFHQKRAQAGHIIFSAT